MSPLHKIVSCPTVEDDYDTRCPVLLRPMYDAVTTTCGHTFSREAILRLEPCICPFDRKPIEEAHSNTLILNQLFGQGPHIIDQKDLLQKANAAYEQKDYEQARRLYFQTMDHDGPSLLPLRYIFNSYIAEKNYMVAQYYIKWVIQYDPKNISSLIKKAFCSICLNNFSEALRTLKYIQRKKDYPNLAPSTKETINTWVAFCNRRVLV